MSDTRRCRDRGQLSAAYRRWARRPTGCAVCNLPVTERELVDLALREGAAIVWTADHYGVSRGAVRRHADHGAGR